MKECNWRQFTQYKKVMYVCCKFGVDVYAINTVSCVYMERITAP